jgi:hypothetical protein
MDALTIDALSKLEPIEQVCFISPDQVHKVRTYMQIDEDVGRFVVDLTDLLMPKYDREESLCRQLHAFASAQYPDCVPPYDQELFSFYQQPGSDNVVILMRTSKAGGDLFLEATTTREPLDQFLENHAEIARECYLIHPEYVQTYLVIQEAQPMALDVTEPVTAAWHRNPQRSICYHLYEWFKMMHKAPSYESMSDHYKFYKNKELGTMVVVLDGRNT